MSTVTQLAGIGSYLDAFSEIQKRTSGQPEWLRSLREKAFGQFCDQGFPTLKHEAWRFTDLAPITKESFALPTIGTAEVTAEDLQPFLISEAACRLVFVNGRFAPALSDRGSLPAGVEADSLAAAIRQNTGTIEAHLGHHLDTEADSFCSLNTAFLEDGAYVHLAHGAVLRAPVHILYITTGITTPTMIHPRNLLVVEREAQADFVESYIALGDGKSFSNVATELFADENSVVAHHILEYENRESFHIGTLQMDQQRNTNVSSHCVLVGGALVRNNIHPVMLGEGGESLINGLFLGDGHQHLDNYMLVDHIASHCASHQFYNGILGGSSHGVFHGHIMVHKDAQQIDAKQTNRNILLSDSAQIDTKPRLEIYADDVKCTHGATIGQIDDNALYYLRTRGIEESAARDLLLFAFASECLERIRSKPAREHMKRIVHQSLPEGMSSAGMEESGVERHWEEIG